MDAATAGPADTESGVDPQEIIYPVFNCPVCGARMDDVLDRDDCWTGCYTCPTDIGTFGMMPLPGSGVMCAARRAGSKHRGRPRIWSYSELVALTRRNAKVA